MVHARDDYNRIQDPSGIIPQDEPVFLLRGQDVAAPAAIEAWIKEAKNNGATLEILEAAQKQAYRMKVWQMKNGNKVPDMP